MRPGLPRQAPARSFLYRWSWHPRGWVPPRKSPKGREKSFPQHGIEARGDRSRAAAEGQQAEETAYDIATSDLGKRRHGSLLRPEVDLRAPDGMLAEFSRTDKRLVRQTVMLSGCRRLSDCLS